MNDSVNQPSDFNKIIKDFVLDIKNTFPEYEAVINKWWIIDEENEEKTMEMIYEHCMNVFPERFMDLLYQNVSIFSEDSEINTEFLPGISFKYIWSCDITENTRETIWKYLQMVTISIIGNVKDKDSFGSAADMFDSIDEEDFKSKLQNALENIQGLFSEKSDVDEETGESSIPNPDDLHEHIQGMLGGKLGQLAQEIAEETTANLDIDFEGIENPTDVLQKIITNPGKLMNIVKDVGGKLEEKMNSGEINKAELMTEASDMLKNMKNIPGMNNIQEMMGNLARTSSNSSESETGNASGPNLTDMMSQMMGEGGEGIPDISNIMSMMGLGRNTKINKSALDNKLKQEKKRQDMINKLKKRQEQANLMKVQEAIKQAQSQELAKEKEPQEVLTDEQIISIFSTGEKYEKTPISKTSNKKKKNKSKNK